jgi:hypothetical protein
MYKNIIDETFCQLFIYLLLSIFFYLNYKFILKIQNIEKYEKKIVIFLLIYA